MFTFLGALASNGQSEPKKSEEEIKIRDIMNSETSRDDKIKALRESGIQPSTQLGPYANACLNIVNSKVNANDLSVLKSQQDQSEFENVMKLYVMKTSLLLQK